MGTRYTFGTYVVPESGRILLREGKPVPITPKVLATLLALVRASGEVVTKEELLRAVWPDSFVEEGNLTQNISVLRKLLATDYPDESPIETIAKVGYRFHAVVEVQQYASERSDHHHAVESSENADSDAGTVVETTQPAVVPRVAPADNARTFRLSWWIWAAPVALLAVAFVVSHGRRVKPAGAPALDFVRFTNNSNENRVTAAAISPDGRQIAYADADGVMLRGERDIATRSVRTPKVRDIERLSWGPDGRHVLMSGSDVSGVQQLWMLSTTGEAPRLLRNHAALGVLSPDGSAVAFVADTRSEIWVEGAGGENPRQVLAGSPTDTFPMVLWSADGKRLLLERHTAFQSDGHFHSPRTEDEIEGFRATYLAVDVESDRITASEDGIRLGNACLLAPDRMVFSRSETTEYENSTSLWRVPIDTHTGKFISTPEKLQDFKAMHLLTLGASQAGAVAAVFTHGRTGIYVGAFHPERGALDGVKLLTASVSNAGPHAWTPDGSAVLFESDYADEHYHIYKQELARHEPESLTANMGGEALPRVTPDGHDILFETKPEPGELSIWRLALSGGNPVLIYRGQRSDEYRCPLSGPNCVLRTVMDSQRLAFWVLNPVRGKGQQLFVMPASWGAHGDWDVSPDGSQVAVVSPDSSQPEIRKILLASAKTQEIPISIESRITAINWLPNDHGWIISASTPLGSELLYVDAKGAAKLLRETAGNTWGVPSPDGSRLAFSDKSVDSNVWLGKL